MIFKVIERSRLPERFVWNGRWYETELAWVKFVRKKGKTEIHASDNGVMWHRLTGTPTLGYNNTPKPEELVAEEAAEPIDYARG